MLTYILVENNYLENFAKAFIIFARQNQFIHENFFFKAQVSPTAIAMNANSIFSGLWT